VEYRWEWAPVDEAKAKELQRALGIHPVFCRLLVQRGISDFDSAKAFFRPELTHLHPPLAMKGMAQALDRLDLALSRGERMLVYGDYDVDGTTAVALVYRFLKRRSDAVEYYIPDRDSEGYGVSEAGVRYAAQTGVGLILTLDCGIKAVERIAEARALGIDVIVADHHLPGSELPDAVAILDPKQADCPYPYPELCGCGIGFKLLQGFVERHQLPKDELYEGLDLVAVSIAADIVPVTGENRVLLRHGLERLALAPRPGLRALLRQAKVNGAPTIRDLVFGLAPRINAAGRMGHARDAVAMLLAETDDPARDGADELQSRNDHRKQEDQDTTREALAMVMAWPDREERFSTVVFAEHWHKGVIGIVASRLIEKHYRPTIVLTASGGQAVGSARSVPGLDIHDTITACADLLDRYGGHPFAAGLSMPLAHVPLFRERFEAAVRERLPRDLLTPRLRIDAELTLPDVKPKFFNILRQFEPFGPGNPAPVFASLALETLGAPRVLKEEHLKVQVRGAWVTFDGIAFGQAGALDLCSSGKPLALAYQVEENRWKDQVSLQLQIKSIKRSEEIKA
jgi:single-stranded-DNA-specific exonuclease